MRELLAACEADATPLYLQLARNLRRHLASGAIDAGHALPSERDLSAMTRMSRVTVRKAIAQLIAEGVLVRKQGSGTFVAQRIDAAGSLLSSFSDDARARGEDPGTVWLSKSYGEPTEEEAAALGIAAGTRVARLGRVRLSGGEPLAIEHAVVPARHLPTLDAIDTSLYAALAAAGVRPATGAQRLRACLATPTEAGILSVRQNAAVLRIERVTRTAAGEAVEFTRSVYRGDRYDVVSDLRGLPGGGTTGDEVR